MLAAGLQSRARRQGRTSRVAVAVQDHLLTVCALTAGVTDAFLQGGTALGLAILVPALIILDFKLQG
jgi:hypothetical protein